jgi:transposase
MSSKKSGKSSLTKVPIDRIKILIEVNFREGINRDRVEYLKDLYAASMINDHPHVQLVQGGDKPNTYVMLDGIHRLEAKKELDAKEIRVNLHYEKAYTPHDLDSSEFLREMALKSLRFNITNSPLPPTLAELRRQVTRLYERGVPIQELATFHAKTSVYRWCEEVTERRQKEKRADCVKLLRDGLQAHEIASQVDLKKTQIYEIAQEEGIDIGRHTEEQKQQCLKIHEETGSAHETSRRTGISRSTVRDWLKDSRKDHPKRGGGNSGNSQNGKNRKNRPPSPDPDQGLSEREKKRRENQKKIAQLLKKLDKIHEELQLFPLWSDELDKFFTAKFIPTLCLKSKKIEAIFNARQYVQEVRLLRQDSEQLCEDLAVANRKNLALEEQIKAFNRERRHRESQCGTKCDLALRNSETELTNAINVLLNKLQKEISVYNSMPAGTEEPVRVIARETSMMILSGFDTAYHRNMHNSRLSKDFKAYLALLDHNGFLHVLDSQKRLDSIEDYMLNGPSPPLKAAPKAQGRGKPVAGVAA